MTHNNQYCPKYKEKVLPNEEGNCSLCNAKLSNEENYVHLIGIGKVKAIPAQELKPNDVIVWNYGLTSTVIEITKQTKSSIFIKTRSKNYSGEYKTYDKTFRKNRLVPIYPKK